MSVLENLFFQIENVKVIDSAIDYDHYTPIDLSASNSILSIVDIQNPKLFELYIENYLSDKNAKVAYGGYNETRSLYNQSQLFNDKKNEERNIHIGIDLWIKAGTAVLAALDGSVYGFANNTDKGDYGPTIILKHQLENEIFYTLYGHLSLKSIENLKIGSIFKKGQQIATLGDSSVNGGYSPHLHFQIIKDIQDNKSDYPGVCSKTHLEYYLDNCPNPNLLLKYDTRFQ